MPELHVDAPLGDLLAEATRIRAAAHGTRVTYSPKVFIPLTMLCRDHCGYCTFAKPPARLGASAYLAPEQVLEIARAGAAAGCSEALFTLGERPAGTARRWSTWPAPAGWSSPRPRCCPTPTPAPCSRTSWLPCAGSRPARA